MVGARAAAIEASGEDGQADAEHPPPAEAVTEGGSGQEQHGEGQGVGVDDPLQALHARVEMGPDRRQGGGHDQVVEADHKRRHRGHHIGPQPVRKRSVLLDALMAPPLLRY